MRNAKRILSLLLVALLAVALLPSAAFADPPQADPTHEHDWQIVSNTATCSEGGIRTWKCAKCGKTYTEKIEAMGHDWDEGTITTEPSGFAPGIMTFTCRRDSSHTSTEQIDPAPWLFATLQGAAHTTSAEALEPLTITEQPKSGAITRYANETCTLSVAVTGGLPPYTYAWYGQDQDGGSSGNAGRMTKWFSNLFGVSPADLGVALATPLSDGPVCTVSAGDRDYWCVVTDRAKNTVVSQRAHVDTRLRIVEQPTNRNLYRYGTVVLSCEAADGLGEGAIEYRWYSEAENYFYKGSTYRISAPGKYYCEVTDGVDTIRSKYAIVYETAPFALVSITGDRELAPGETCQLAAVFTGGTEAFEVRWEKDGTAISSTEGHTDGQFSSTVPAAGSGVYTVFAVDAMGETVQASVVLTDRPLAITEQPDGGVIPTDGYAEMAVTVSGGEGPYTYTLSRSGGYEVRRTEDSNACVFQVWYPGEYCICVEDSRGLAATTNKVMYTAPDFRIWGTNTAGELRDKAIRLSVTVDGGAEPTAYYWSVAQQGQNFRVGGDSKSVTVSAPGDYQCRVTDRNGRTIYSKTIPVAYTGLVPYILWQPQGVELEKAGDTARLTCIAVSGTGNDANLTYAWEKRSGVDKNGWLSEPGSTGPALSVTEVGEYRCKITDIETGKSIYSEAASVTEPLTIAGVQQIRAGSRSARFEISFTGGQAPYMVKTFVQLPDRLDGVEDVLIATDIIDGTEGSGRIVHDLDSVIPVVRFDGGEHRQTTVPAIYYVIVYDANNNQCRSDYFGHN